MPGQGTVTIKGKSWSVSVANTLTELTQGLSGVESIPAQTGMLFDLGSDQKHIEIDMSQMLFPLDIVFINSTQGVVGVFENVQPGEQAILDNDVLPGARLFLEVNAGEAQGIEDGDPVDIQGYAQPAQLSIVNLFQIAVLIIAAIMMMKMMGVALLPAKKRPELRAPAVTREEELQEKKATLENQGREMARKTGAEFVELVEGWQGKYATPMYRFKDPATGKKIVARDLEDLEWKLSVLHYKPEHHSSSPGEHLTIKGEVFIEESEHHSMWLTSEQREPLEKKYGAIAVRWAEEATRPGDIKGVETAAEYYYKKVKEALGLGHLSPELTEEQIMKLREVLGLPADIAQILKIHRETGYVP